MGGTTYLFLLCLCRTFCDEERGIKIGFRGGGEKAFSKDGSDGGGVGNELQL